MNYSNEEITKRANKHLRQSEECQRRILETVDFAKRQWVIQNLERIIAEQKADITNEEFQQLVENSLQFMNEQEMQRNIVVNEITLGGC